MRENVKNLSVYIYTKFSTKFKNSRKHFSITQYSFSKFGIRQHYISMLESDKGSSSQEMIISIYDALYKITKLYTKEEFSMNLEQQAISWINTYYEPLENKRRKTLVSQHFSPFIYPIR